MKKTFVFLIGALVALGLPACGGGGGGSAGPAPPPGLPATGTINSGSVLLISGRSVDAVLQSGLFGSITDFVGLTAIGADDPGRSLGGAAKPVGAYIRYQVPVGPDTSSCAVSGTVTVSGDIANPLTVTPGDFLDYVWDDCDDGDGAVIDGFIGMTFTGFDGNLLAGRILLGVSLDVNNFRITEGGELNVTNGDLTLTIDSRSQPNTVIETLGSTLAIANSTGTDTLLDFTNTVTEDTSVFPGHFTTEATGAIRSSRYSGYLSYDTPDPFESTGANFPHTGELIVFGTSNSRARIIAMSKVDVRIEADYDGDGAFDATIDTTWAALLDN